MSRGRCHVHVPLAGTLIGTELCPECRRMVAQARDLAMGRDRRSAAGRLGAKAKAKKGGRASPWRGQKALPRVLVPAGRVPQ